MSPTAYRGRFAPSPTGPLHFGSLVTAMASFLEARRRGGEWLLRIDDLDQTRCVPGMADQVMQTLERLGLHWDGQVVYQSQCNEDYQNALDELTSAGTTYVCHCTRNQIRAGGRPGIEGPVYPDTCRTRGFNDDGRHAVRVRTDNQPITFDDGLYGHQQQYLHEEVGDFVVRRADGYFAYQLAVVVDDARAGITHIVRGADLLLSTARQIYLQRLLKLPGTHYLHIPLVRDSAGRKLSKTDKDHPVDETRPVDTLLDAWRYLGQSQPRDCDMSLPDFLDWAISHWQPSQLIINAKQP